jgi:hypothetical protein
MASDRVKNHLLVMIENMQREGRDEAEIARAIKEARGESTRPERRPLRKAVQLGRWRVEVARL